MTLYVQVLTIIKRNMFNYYELDFLQNGSGIIPTDYNVLHAWRKCLNGTGIIVAVVDDGIFDHPDLNIVITCRP